MKEHFEWLVDRNVEDESGDVYRVDIKQDGLELKLERLSYGRSAVVFSQSKTESIFKSTLTDSAEEGSGQALTFAIALSGYITGNLLNRSEFVMDKNFGVLADFSDGSADFILHPGETIRSFSGEFDLSVLSDLFREEWQSIGDSLLRELTDSPGSLLRAFRITPQIRQLASNAYNNTQLSGPLRRLYMEGASLQIMALILDQRIESPRVGRPEEIDLIARKAVIEELAELVSADLRDPPSLQQLCYSSGLSARQLNAGFKELYGYSVFDFLCDKRLVSARDLLMDEPDYPLKVLAHKLGYSHPNNFIAAFKRKFGFPPRQYAKMQRN